jgi:DNA polymerase-1
VYPVLLEAGVRVERCHEVSAVEGLLQTYDGEPFVPPRSITREPASRLGSQQISLFADGVVEAPPSVRGGRGQRSERPAAGVGGGPEDDPAGGDPAVAETRESPRTQEELRLLHADQLARIDRVRQTDPGFRLLVAAESAASLAAVEMGRAGLPWSVSIHDRVLEDLLGPRPQHTGRPRKLQDLAEEVSGLLGPDGSGPGHPFNPDSPADVLKAFKRQGIQLRTTRAWELKTIDHPAVEPLLRYKELARLHVAHGWAWQDQWVRGGRFHAEYVPGGVVTGRWATSGGGALQIPKVMRACVVADPGWVLVAADAGQLEPRILAALSGDRGMIAATADPDLYTALARQALGKPEARAEAKIGLLAAMYGARANTPAMVALQRRFPQALALLERAARTGENGGTVRSVLGRTCPPPEPAWQDVAPEQALSRSRARGRFTRNFVIQASAADWANALVAGLRRRLAALGDPGGRAELVFFQHDEVIVHAPAGLSEAVVDAIVRSGAEATALVLGDRGVRIPLAAAPIGSYAEKN